MKALCLIVALFSVSLTAAEPVLHPELEIFRPYIDSHWEGDLTEPGKEKKMVDRSIWSRVLNGQAIKTVHSVNNGEYGGETMIFWDQKQQKIAYYYFTTAGFYTHGTMSYNATTKSIEAVEQVQNNAQGITQVRSHSVLNESGTLEVSSDYLQNGQWVKGHSATYKRVPQTQVTFR
ncbi:hypothetical protein [Rheinheimera soli]|jgi:hypothetical protein|uniref:DUF1579 domain-containing protein n=1 Tax=Rheinheimera soli TaxID=443616 RepID=A0ABU1VVM1_9GAMM|nr:hypothetical protein [Rheinheimera soli]MDR7119423.1 hypothetical protein [Rheinheimera soli]